MAEWEIDVLETQRVLRRYVVEGDNPDEAHQNAMNGVTLAEDTIEMQEVSARFAIGKSIVPLVADDAKNGGGVRLKDLENSGALLQPVGGYCLVEAETGEPYVDEAQLPDVTGSTARFLVNAYDNEREAPRLMQFIKERNPERYDAFRQEAKADGVDLDEVLEQHLQPAPASAPGL